MQPKAQLGQGDSGVDVSDPVHATLIAYLSGPAAEVTPLTALIPVQYNAEAQQANCAYVLASSVTQKKSKFGGLKKFASVAAPVVGMTGGMGGSAGGMAAAQAAAMAGNMAQQEAWQEQSRAQITEASHGNVRKGDKITLEYSLTSVSAPGSDAAASKTTPITLEGKASEDGEDVLSPLLEQAATEVLTVVLKQ